MPFRGLKTRDVLVECGHLSSILERKQLPFVVLNKKFYWEPKVVSCPTHEIHGMSNE